MTHWICGVLAIGQKLVIGPVGLDQLILLKGEQEVEERFLGNLKALDGFAECDHYGMFCVAGITLEKLITPPAQQGEGLLTAARFIAEVVRPAAIGINRVKMRR